jgi:phosphoserine aminotransferase
MNVIFTLIDDNLSTDFNNAWEDNYIVGLKGHRSVGGYRASIYNALPIESIELLIKCMQQFEEKFK